MPCTAESCRDGLTSKCFAECPKWAERAFRYRMLHMLVRAAITRRLPKGLGEGLIAPGVEIPPGIIFPPGTIVSPGTIFPPGWMPADPLPDGTLVLPGATFPPGWTPADPLPEGIMLPPDTTLPPDWSPGDPLPPGALPPPVKYMRDIGGTKGISVIPPSSLAFGPGSLMGGSYNTAGAGGAGCGCCKHKDNPEENVGIGYETAEMELSADQELTVTDKNEWCEGHFYEWMITKGGGELSAGEGLNVVYTAPTSGHGCPGNTEITLYCCGEVMDTLDIVINYDYAIEFNYDASAETIDRETSEAIYATANGTPLTWSVGGTGFSLEHAETDGCGNILHADETACGPAMITVTDCDGNPATGYVRCTEGSWVLINNDCVMSGPGEVELFANYYDITEIQGKAKQVVKYREWIGGSETRSHREQDIALDLAIVAARGHCVSGPCMSGNVVDCASLKGGASPINLGCVMNNLGCRNAGNCVWNDITEMWDCTVDYFTCYSRWIYYYEWQC